MVIVKDSCKDYSLDFEHLRCDPHKNPSQKRGIRAHFQLRFSLKIIISGQRPYFIKDFLQRFLAKQPPKHPYKFRLNWHTPLFSRHGIIKASLTSLTFLTIGKLQASLIFRSLNRKVRFCSWLNENNPMIDFWP